MLNERSSTTITWSAPVKINSDPDGANKDQYYPWMSVLPNGQIWVGWNDRRDDANNFLSKWYQAHSDDEGTTWLDINNAPGNDVVADVQTQPSTFIGDYHGLGAGDDGTQGDDDDVLQLVKPPVDAPASRHRRPATSIESNSVSFLRSRYDSLPTDFSSNAQAWSPYLPFHSE